jgi:hypothetical protein
MSRHPAPPPFAFSPLPVTVTSSSALLSSDAGLLPLRQLDERLGFTAQLAAAPDDPRDPRLIATPAWRCPEPACTASRRL